MIYFILMLIGSYLFYYFTGNATLVLSLLVGMLLILFWGSHLKLESARQEVERAKGNIEDAFQKRHDVLIKLLDSVKNALKEKDKTNDLLEDVIKSIYKEKPSGTFFDKINKKNRDDYEVWVRESKNTLTQLMNSNHNVANTQFNMLNKSINEVEENLSAARRFYNYAVKEYNSSLTSFPSNLISKRKGYQEAEYFNVEDEEIRKDVKISFD